VPDATPSTRASMADAAGGGAEASNSTSRPHASRLRRPPARRRGQGGRS
jgi:hypothetical protein